jgi:Flp pilus assembly protein TadG
MMPHNSISHRHSERGNVLVLTAMTLLLMLGLMALAIDLGYLLNGKAELQNALDSAALAAISQTHVVIPKLNENYPTEQVNLVVGEANKFAGLNEVRRNSGGGNTITLNPADINLLGTYNQIPDITITKQVALPTFFAGILGFTGVGVSAQAKATLVYVDGGTGLISGGKVKVDADGNAGDVVTGGWRPLILPDTYFELSGDSCPCDATCGALKQLSFNPTYTDLIPPVNGSFYRSRFASATASYPLVDSWQEASPGVHGTNCNPTPTGLRDAFGTTLVSTLKNLMGQKFQMEGNPTIAPGIADYRVVNLAATYGSGAGSVEDQAYYGYTGQIKVGDIVTVFPVDDLNVQTAQDELLRLWNDASTYAENVRPDKSDTGKLIRFGYVTTCSGCPFETPNTHPLVVPVLLCNPFEYYRKMKGIETNNPNQLTVTNIGALFLDNAAGRVIVGRFVREMFVGGTPVAAGSVPYPWMLPASARLAR